MNWPIKANWPAQRRTRFGPITEDQRNPRYNNQFELGGFSSSQISLLFCQPPFLISEAVVVPFLKIEGRSSREQRMNGRKVEVQQLPNLITRYIACRSPERFMAVFLGQQKEGHKKIYFAGQWRMKTEMIFFLGQTATEGVWHNNKKIIHSHNGIDFSSPGHSSFLRSQW